MMTSLVGLDKNRNKYDTGKVVVRSETTKLDMTDHVWKETGAHQTQWNDV